MKSLTGRPRGLDRPTNPGQRHPQGATSLDGSAGATGHQTEIINRAISYREQTAARRPGSHNPFRPITVQNWPSHTVPIALPHIFWRSNSCACPAAPVLSDSPQPGRVMTEVGDTVDLFETTRGQVRLSAQMLALGPFGRRYRNPASGPSDLQGSGPGPDFLGIGGVRGCFRHWRDPLGGRRFRAQSAAQQGQDDVGGGAGSGAARQGRRLPGGLVQRPGQGGLRSAADRYARC